MIIFSGHKYFSVQSVQPFKANLEYPKGTWDILVLVSVIYSLQGFIWKRPLFKNVFLVIYSHKKISDLCWFRNTLRWALKTGLKS